MMTGRNPHRQYRRHARRSWRHGTFPVMLIGAGEPLGLIAVAALSRWLFRHRSAFAPFGIAVAEFAVAAMLHHDHERSWAAALCSTVITAIILGVPHRFLWAHPSLKVTAGILARAWEACGIDRPAERAYATTVVIAAGGWLTAAVAIGPAVKPLPAIAVISTVVLSIPWWAHRRRRARVRAIRTIQAWPDLAENMGLPGSRIASVVIDAWGWTGRLILRKGTTAAQAINQLPAIESGLGIRPGTARAVPDPARADRVILRVIEKDPHAEPIPWKEPGSATIIQPIDLGLYETGTPVLVSFLRRNVLIAGTTGAGKSIIVSIVVAQMAKCADVERWGIDMKGGMELKPWAQTLHKLATTPQQATALLAAAVAKLDERAAHMAALGLRVWEPAPDDPAIEILIDEYAELPPEALEHADSIARRGRAVAVNLIAATQRPTQEAMGGNAVRSQMDVRICLRVRERRDTDLILGQGALSAGWDASALTQPGTFLISDPEHATPDRARAYLITDAQVAAHAARYALTPADHAHAGPGHTEPPARGSAHRAGHDDLSAPSDAAQALWKALCHAGSRGITPKALAAVTGMGRTWVHQRLREHATAGRAIQVRYGRWCAAEPTPEQAQPRREPAGRAAGNHAQ
jgi:DNA segregation ATPase FtsK/SpoIIIE, S-DNA-T family